MVKIMCKMFEVVTGKRSKGSVDKLEGLTKMYTDINEEIAIIKIPVELMEVDSRYQTDERTERDLQYLVRNWDERKLMPLMGVPHWEEGKVYIVDGYGRWIAKATVKYPMLDMKTAVSLYTEDMVVKNLGLEQSREVSGTRVVPIKRTKTA